MKKYLLFVAGDISDTSFRSFVIDIVSDITQTEFLKFKAHSTFILLHFGTNLEFQKVKDYFSVSLEKDKCFYFLSEHTDILSSNLDNNDLEEFLLLDNIKFESKISMEEEQKLINELQQECLDFMTKQSYLDDEGEDEDMELKYSRKTYTVDEILDKINEKGINSLTKEEKEYLNSLSK